MTTKTRIALLAALAGATALPAAAQTWETTIGVPTIAGLPTDNTILDDTINIFQDAAGFAPGPISVGWTSSAFSPPIEDMYIARQDSAGALIWDTILSSGGRDQANEIVTSFMGGYAVVGETDALGFPGGLPGRGISLTEIDAGGSQVWSRLYTGTSFIGDTQGGADVVAVSNGGYAISGRADPSAGVPALQAPVAIRTGPAGTPVWANAYVDPFIGSEFFASFADIQEFRTAAGEINFIAAGYVSRDGTGSRASRDTLVMRLNDTGAVLWSFVYPQPWGEEALGVEIAGNGTIIVTGREHGTSPLDDASFMMRLVPAGAPLWYNRYFGFAATDGSVLEVGSARIATIGADRDPALGGPVDVLLMQTDPLGVPTLVTEYSEGRNDSGDALAITDGGFYLGANATSYGDTGENEFYVLKTDFAGETGCERVTQVGYEPWQTPFEPIQLIPFPIPENLTWMWGENNPNFPVNEVCDDNPCPDCVCDWAPPLGVCDFNDFIAFLTAFTAGDPCADLNGNTTLEFGDIIEFLGDFGAPCP